MQRVLTTADLAGLLGWSTTRTRRWLSRQGCLVKRGGRYVTTPRLLAERWPEVYSELVLDLEEADGKSDLSGKR